MKILHILDHSLPLQSGYVFRTQALLREQRRLGWQTFQLTSAKQGITLKDVEAIDGWLFYRSQPATGWLGRLPGLEQWAVINSLRHRLEQVVKQVKPDILHVHSPALNGIAALVVAKKYRLGLVYECRAFWEDAAVDQGKSRPFDLRYRLSRTLENHVFRHADGVVAICQGVRDDIVSRGIVPGKLVVVGNGVDGEQFAFDQPVDVGLRQRLGLQDALVLGFFGSFYRYEGLSLMLAALPAVISRYPNLRLVLAGGGPEQAEISAMIKRLDLRGHVLELGRLPQQQMAGYYSVVDVMVYPRLASRLTELVTPLKPLEAMAQGCIVLAADVGGHRELIEDGKTGFLFRAGDQSSLVATLRAVLENRARWPVVRRAARHYVETRRSWQQSVEMYRPLYQQLMVDRL